MATKTVLETLIAARKLITPRSRWCKGDFALDKKGNSVDPNSPEAVKWCMDGALGKIQNSADGGFGKPYTLLKSINNSIATFNDTHAHAKVLAAFDAAIEKALAEGK